MVEVTAKAASEVSTQDLPPVPEEAVVTSDLPKADPETDKKPVTDPTPKGENPDAAASKPDDPNDQTSATDDPTTSKPPRNKRRWDKLLAKLTKAEEALKTERESRWVSQKQLEELKETVTSLRAKVEKPPAPQKKPQLADFEEPEKYAAAFADWKKSQEAPSTPKPDTKPAKAEPPADTPPTLDPDKLAAFHKAGKKFGDTFAEAVQDDSLQISPAMGEYLVDSKHGAAIMVHLSNNPDEARNIHAKGTPLAQFRAMEALASKAGKDQLDLDTGLELLDGDEPDPDDETSPGTHTTKAPAPPSNTRDTGIPQVVPNPEKEPMDDYAARRQREELTKRGVILK